MHFGRFLRQIFSHWISGMTGGFSLPLAIAGLWLPSTPQRIGFVGLSLFCAFIAVYRVWLVESERAADLERRLMANRPFIVPEAVIAGGAVGISLRNIGARPALNVTIAALKSFDGSAEFDTIQMITPDDARVTIGVRCTNMLDLRRVLGCIHLAEALRGQREGKEGTDFVVPIALRYADASGTVYEDGEFSFSWIPSATGVPLDTQLLIRRSEVAAISPPLPVR